MSGPVRWAVLATGQQEDTEPATDRLAHHWAHHWVRLGARTVVWAADDPGAASLAEGARSAAGLGLVTQVGASFRREHPDVEVLVEAGRHLVVDLDAWSGAAATQGHDWRLEPLPTDEVVVDAVEVAAPDPDPAVASLVAGLDPDRVSEDLAHLVSLGSRHSLSTGFGAAVSWAAERLAGLGFAVSQPVVPVGGGQSANVVAERAGTAGGPRPAVLITAHLDSVNLAGGQDAPAPGADDNGSGSAGALELARVLAATDHPHDLRVILFGGEEQGLFGSRQYVAALAAEERSRIHAVLNMDMIGTLTGPPSVLLEGAPASRHLIDDLAVAAATYTSLAVTTSLHPFASDHVPFLDAGIPAVLTIEGNDSSNHVIHTAEDTMQHVTVPFLMQILAMNAATAYGWLGLGVPTPSAPESRTGEILRHQGAGESPMSAEPKAPGARPACDARARRR